MSEPSVRATNRSISLRGVRFYRDGETVMFVHHLDSSTREGPREATAEDANTHPEAWERFLGEAPDVSPFQPLVVPVTVGEAPEEEEGPHAKRRNAAAAAKTEAEA